MATPFSDLVGEPFPDSIKEELERRRSLAQDYETSPSLYNPFFKLRRLEKMSYQDEPRPEYQYSDRKFWELQAESKNGMDDIEETDSKKAPVGITDVSIEVKDYTFHTVTVNFTIPDINDWEIFKETWLKFGAPVEYEFGRFTPVQMENQNDDVQPDLEIREGMVANFSWNLGESNRTITGSLTIYSATWIQLMQEAHADVDFNPEMVSIVEEALKRPFIDIEQSTQLRDGREVISNRNPDSVDLDKYFYAVLNEKRSQDVRKSLEKAEQTREGASSGASLGNTYQNFSKITNSGTLTSTFSTRYPADMVETIPNDLVSNLFVEQSNVSQVYRMPSLTDQQIEEVRLIARDNQRNQDNQSDLTGVTGFEDNQSAIFQQYINFFEFYESGDQTRLVLNNKYRNIGNTDLQKYALSNLNLDENLSEKINTSMHFYVSLRFVNDIVNRMMRQFYDDERVDILSNLILTDVKIRDLSYLGFGSAYPDRMIINPWNRSYKKNPDYNPLKPLDDGASDNLDVKPNRAFIEDSAGSIKLLEDVHISADVIMELVQDAKSPMGFVQNVIDEIHASSKNLLKLQKVEKNIPDEGRIIGRDITYFDASLIFDKSKGNKAYHTFNLFDLKEKINDIGVQTDLGDEFAKLAFFRSRGTVKEDDGVFYYAGDYYNQDGTPAEEPLPTAPDLRRRSNGLDFGSSNPDLNPFVIDINAEINEFDKVVTYKKKANEIIQSINTKFDTANNDVQQRVHTSKEDSVEGDSSIAFIAYIQAYFEVLVDLYRLTNDPLAGSEGTTIIPLKVDLTLDGIAGIFAGQVFKIDLRSFPMAYNIENVEPLFVVTTLGHTFSGNDWETTVGAMLFIPAKAQQGAILESEGLTDLISSKNARLEIINNVFKTKIHEILEDR